MKNKLILFDWGNIVESHSTGYSCRDAYNDLFQECGYKDDKDIFSLLGKYKLACIKNIDEYEKTYEQISKEFNLNKTFEEYVDLYKKIFDKITYYKDVAQYEISLKDKCYIGILSDLTIFDKERLNKQVNLSNYDYVFLSFELGIKKANIELFNIVQSKVPFLPKDILLIDDRKENIDNASKLGWNVFQTTGLNLDKIKEKCESFLKGE